MIKIANSKEPYTYYVITSGGWVRDQDSLDDSDHVLKAVGKKQNQYILHEQSCITNFIFCSKNSSFNELHVANDT